MAELLSEPNVTRERMRVRIALACLLFLGPVAGGGTAAASDQCLSAAELRSVSRMASAMAVGAAVRRCGRCLGREKYAQVVQAFDDSELVLEFRRAQKAVEETSERSTIAYIDGLVRDSARRFADTLSVDCTACERTADTIKGLLSAGARAAFYKREAAAVAGAPQTEVCGQSAD